MKLHQCYLGVVVCFGIILVSVYETSAAHVSKSCLDKCGDKYDKLQPCQCNTICTEIGDCCTDFRTVCKETSPRRDLSCENHCNILDKKRLCQCNTACALHGDCCTDYQRVCKAPETVTEEQLCKVTEELFKLDVNNVGKYITINLQSRTTKNANDDPSPKHLLVVKAEALKGTTFTKFDQLLHMYHKDVTVQEKEDAASRKKIAAYFDVVLATSVMNRTVEFLFNKDLIERKEYFRPLLRDIWFKLFNVATSTTKTNSCGFEHVFVGEVNKVKPKVIGLHNWVKFHELEKAGTVNYQGYEKNITFHTNKGAAVDIRYQMDKVTKPISGFFIGTSPELEMAYYTICFLARPNRICNTCPQNIRIPIVVKSVEDVDGNTYISNANVEL